MAAGWKISIKPADAIGNTVTGSVVPCCRDNGLPLRGSLLKHRILCRVLRRSQHLLALAVANADNRRDVILDSVRLRIDHAGSVAVSGVDKLDRCTGSDRTGILDVQIGFALVVRVEGGRTGIWNQHERRILNGQASGTLEVFHIRGQDRGLPYHRNRLAAARVSRVIRGVDVVDRAHVAGCQIVAAGLR